MSSLSIRRPIFTIAAMLFILVLGIVSVMNIPLKLIPDIHPPIGAVVSSYPGANPQEVLEKVTRPLESQLATLPGLRSMTSTSQEGASLTLLEFNWNTTLDEVESDILSRMNRVRLPVDAAAPSLLKFDPSQLPVIQLALTGDPDPQAFRERVETFEQQLAQVEGVASVDTSGLRVEELRVELDQESLQLYGLTQRHVVDVIQSHNISLPGEPIQSQDQQLTARVIGMLTSLDELRGIPVTIDPETGQTVTLADVGEVRLIHNDQQVKTRVNQEPAVLMSVLQQSDANTVSVSNAFHARLEEMLDRTDHEWMEAVILFDQGDYVKLAIRSMVEALVLGGAFAMIVLFLFLRNIKSPLIVGVAIPFSVIFTFVLLYFADFSLNIMTLGGLALGIGMLVDNSIVVTENIHRHMIQLGKDRQQAAASGAAEVAGAITASTLTTIAVFVPIVFTEGMVGNLFKEFSITIAFSLFASLIVALTVVPMLAGRFMTARKSKRENSEQPVRRGAEEMAKWALRHRALVLFFTAVLLGAGLFGLTMIGTQFLPASDEGFFTIEIQLQDGMSLDDTDESIKHLEQYLDQKREVDHYLTLVGGGQNVATGRAGRSNESQVLVRLVEEGDRSVTTAQFVDKIDREVRQLFPGANDISFQQQASTGTQPNTITFIVRHDDSELLRETVQLLDDALRNLDELSKVSNSLTETTEEVQITVDRNRAFQHGLTPAQIALFVNEATRGVNASTITTSDKQVYNISVHYDSRFVESTDMLRRLRIHKPDGTSVPLEDVAVFSRGEGPSVLNRVDQEEAVEFHLKYRETERLGDVSTAIRNKIDELDLPKETDVYFTGDTEMMDAAMQDLVQALVLAVLFVYLVMTAQFESFTYPIVIMVSVPLIVIGVSIALFVTDTPLSVTAVVGLLVLAGIVVNNAIVLVDFILKRKRDGRPAYEAIVESVAVRMRPILMTASTTILGLVPIALALGEGTEIQQPLGITVIGGLLSSTLLTLFVIPVIYSYFDPETRWMKRRKRALAVNSVDRTDPVEQLKHLTREQLLELIQEIEKDKK